MKHNHYLLVLVLLLAGSLPTFSQYSGSGNGTEEDPYQIFNETQLSQVSNFLNQEGGGVQVDVVLEPDDHQVEMFMRFFEEIELLIQENAMDEETVYYMFSYYVLEFDKRKDRWSRVDYDSADWQYFQSFIQRMKRNRDSKMKVNLHL